MQKKSHLKSGELKLVKAVKIFVYSTVIFIILAAVSCVSVKDKRFLDAFSNEREIIENNPDIICFRGVNVVPMNENVILEDMTVTVSDGVISSIVPSSAADIPEGVFVINGSGKYLMPGLTDMHMHSSDLPENDLIMFLANGVTTVRIMSGAPYHIEIKNLITNNEILGPDFFTTGPLIDGKHPIWEGSTVVSNAEEAKAAVIENVREGYDYIKVYDLLSAEAYTAIMATADEYGIKVVGHIPHRVSFQKAYDSGQYSIEHSHLLEGRRYALDSEEMDEILAEFAASDTWVCPTVVIYDAMFMELPQLAKKTGMQFLTDWAKNSTMMLPEKMYFLSHFDTDYCLRLLKKLYDSGIKLTIGTDLMIAGFSFHDELRLYIEAGIPIYETLKIATSGSAEHLEISDQTGTVEEGKNADLVLLNTNPLENINFREDIEGVMVRGIWLDRETLDSLLVTCEKRAAENQESILY